MWKYVLAGGGSGCCSTCVLTPVELVKCRLQAQIGARAPPAGAPPLFAGPTDVIARTVRAEGLAGLFRGNLSTLTLALALTLTLTLTLALTLTPTRQADLAHAAAVDHTAAAAGHHRGEG